jgi:hypothetical protein
MVRCKNLQPAKTINKKYNYLKYNKKIKIIMLLNNWHEGCV